MLVKKGYCFQMSDGTYFRYFEGQGAVYTLNINDAFVFHNKELAISYHRVTMSNNPRWVNCKLIRTWFYLEEEV